MDVHSMIERLLPREGGYVNHPSDPGGATNFGISVRFLRKQPDWARYDHDDDGDLDALDMRALTKDDALELYTRIWFDSGLGDLMLPDIVVEQLFDHCVNAGPRAAWKLLQSACNLSAVDGDELLVDGLPGPRTRRRAARVKTIAGERMFGELVQSARHQWYRDLVRRRPDLRVFERGWSRRVAECYDDALEVHGGAMA